MKSFVYKAKNAEGRIAEGAIKAPSESDAIKLLTGQGIYPTAIEEASAQGNKRVRVGPVPLKYVAVFTGQLGHLLKSGLPLVKSLDILKQQTTQPALQQVTHDIVTSIQEGKRFSEALAPYEGIFGRFYVSMIRAAEAGGNLDYVLEMLAAHLEKECDLKSRITSACVYPSVIFGVGVLTILIVMMFVIPKMSAMYDELGQSLPLITAVLVSLSTIMVKFWWLVIGAIGVCVYGMRTAFRLAGAQSALGSLVLSVPIWGELWQKADLIRMTKTLGMLLKSGVSYLEALSISGDVVHNALFKGAIADAQSKVQQGIALSQVCMSYSIFPALVTQLVLVGEESGSVDDSLFRISEVYEKEVDRYVKVLVTLIEPMLILLIGGAVACIAAAMFLPIFSINLLAQ